MGELGTEESKGEAKLVRVSNNLQGGPGKEALSDQGRGRTERGCGLNVTTACGGQDGKPVREPGKAGAA